MAVQVAGVSTIVAAAVAVATIIVAGEAVVVAGVASIVTQADVSEACRAEPGAVETDIVDCIATASAGVAANAAILAVIATAYLLTS